MNERGSEKERRDDSLEVLLFLIAFIYLTSLMLREVFKSLSLGRSKSERKGAAGEMDIVRRLPADIPRSRIFKNVYVKFNDKITEVDIVILDRTGIYVIESKNYSGLVSGDVRAKSWKYRHSGGKEYAFYNPVWQNNAHMAAIQGRLNLEESALVSYVVFGEGSEIGLIKGEEGTKVMHVSKVHDAMTKDMQSRRTVFSESHLSELQKWLKKRTNADSVTKERHLQAVRQIQAVQSEREKERERPS